MKKMITIILYAHELEFDVSIVQHKRTHTASPKPQYDL